MTLYRRALVLASPYVLAATVMAALLLSAAPALADKIDGNWCFKDGRHMSIDGPAIVTPGGTKMAGEYDRHGFRYVVPAGEADTGARVGMIQFDDDTIQVTTTPTGAAARTEIWNRCDLTTRRHAICGEEARPDPICQEKKV